MTTRVLPFVVSGVPKLIIRPNGRMERRTYRRHAPAWSDEIATHRKAIIRRDEARRTSIEEAIALVDLAQELPDLQADREPAGKEPLLREVVSTSYWWASDPSVELRKPSHLRG